MVKQTQDQTLFRRTGEGRYQLDLIGYGCPHVQIFTEKALGKLRSGDELTVVFDSPASGETVAWLVNARGDELAAREDAGGTFTWTIRRA